MISQSRAFSRGASILVCYSSGFHQNVQELEETFLVAWDEEAHSYICFSVFDVPAGQGRASEAIWFASVIANTTMEMGAHYDGFCG